jgi:hypothetical protein
LDGVTVSRFNEQAKRNAKRFPEDFAFILTKEKYEALRAPLGARRSGARRRRLIEPDKPISGSLPWWIGLRRDSATARSAVVAQSS